MAEAKGTRSRTSGGATIQPAAVAVLRWQVAAAKQSSFGSELQKVLPKIAERGLVAVLMQPVNSTEDPVWELRIEAPSFASLASLLDDSIATADVDKSSLLDAIGVAARDRTTGPEPNRSGGADLFRAWVSEPVQGRTKGVNDQSVPG